VQRRIELGHEVLHLAGSDPFRQGLEHRLGDLAGLGAAPG
jgi:hypothetical protein